MGSGPERRHGCTVRLHHAERMRRHAQLLCSAERSRETGGHVALDGGAEDSRVAGLRRQRSSLPYVGRGRDRRRPDRDDRAVAAREGRRVLEQHSLHAQLDAAHGRGDLRREPTARRRRPGDGPRRLVLAGLGVTGAAALARVARARPSAPTSSPGTSLQDVYDKIARTDEGFGEARIPVESLSGSATAQYVFRAPGVYYLTGNITG